MADNLRKQAGVWADYFGGAPTHGTLSVLKRVPVVGPVAQAAHAGLGLGSTIHGLSQPVSDKDIEEMDNSVGMGLVPGVADSRMLRRFRHSAEKTGGKHPMANVVGENLGSSVPILASMIAGAAIGAIAKSTDKLASTENIAASGLMGAGIGGGLAGLATLAGFGAAGLTPRRTKAEQKEHDDSVHAENWMIPGAAAYNRAKRFGRLLEEQDEREAKRTVKKEAAGLAKQAAVGVIPVLTALGIGASATGGGMLVIDAYKRKKEAQANKALNAILRAALVGGGTYLGTGLLDPDNEYRGRRALASLAAAGGMGAYDLKNGLVSNDDYATLWRGLKDKYNA